MGEKKMYFGQMELNAVYEWDAELDANRQGTIFGNLQV